MKKINNKQKAVIEFFRKQLSFWKNSHDIESLTHLHNSDSKEELGILYDTGLINPDEYDRIESVTRIIYLTIKQLKE